MELCRTAFYYNLNVIQKDNNRCIMEKLPAKIQNLSAAYLKKKNYPFKEILSHIKWIQYYCDFG